MIYKGRFPDRKLKKKITELRNTYIVHNILSLPEFTERVKIRLFFDFAL